jgi:D-arabinose 1-dehydrogenase
MGLLRTTGGQPWHPASAEMKLASEESARLILEKGSTLEKVALTFGLSSVDLTPGSVETTTVIGLSTPEEVHETVEVYAELYAEGKESRGGRRPGTGLSEKAAKAVELEKLVVDVFQKSKTYNQTWSQGL